MMTENIDVNTLLEGLGGWGKWQVGLFFCFHQDSSLFSTYMIQEKRK